MIFLRLNKDEFTPVSFEEIRAQEKPFYLFLGGLLHLNGLEVGKGLSGILHEMIGDTDAPLYTVQINPEPNVSKTAGQMHQYQADRVPTEEATQIVENLFIDEEGNPTPSLSNVNIVGYSYGTNLIQQIETVLRNRLNQEDIKFLENVRCVNIGPVATPNITLSSDNTDFPFTKELQKKVDEGNSSEGRFKQIFLFRKDDKVMQEVIGDALYDRNENAPHFGYSCDHLTFIIDNCGDDILRRIGISKYPSGIKTPRMDYIMDHEGHSLRVYTNTLKVVENSNKGDFAVIPSSTLAETIKYAVSTMSNWDKNFLTAILHEWKANGLCAEQKITDVHARFDLCLRQYRENLFSENFNFVSGILQEIKAGKFVTNPKLSVSSIHYKPK